MEEKVIYQCNQCGYETDTISEWCPQCKEYVGLEITEDDDEQDE